MNQQKTILPFRAMSSLLLRGAQLLQPLSRHPNPTATLCYAHMGNYWSSESLFPKYQGGKCHIQPLPIQEYACSLHLLHTAAGEVQELILLTPFHLWINNSGEVLFEVTAGERWSFRFQSSMKQKRYIKKKKKRCFHPSEQTKHQFAPQWSWTTYQQWPHLPQLPVLGQSKGKTLLESNQRKTLNWNHE